ncbi:membrane-associated tyrosine- and threonine-specific cdc2-inhibitory kinase [Culex pipiens pallens]|uniref:membrane-associated tyrosine- and threonine-specific cdc2-inhibitory kinase n=1 Tax=Culex pipiens pallens TaxID=42434 RepID=UPI0019549B13|nr:membrane-associated tyrosine- and threonine-specific cdc2-inhibitory kinase [Culex pipiens pallens]
MKSPLPVPEFLEENNLSLSFKQPHRRNQVNQRPPKPPKLYPKFDASFSRSLNGSCGASAISFRNGGARAELSTLYQRDKRESYYEQCFEQIAKVGEGSFGEVFKVKSKVDGCLYAVKKSKEFFRGEHYRQERLEEVRRYEQFSEHENCVKLIQAWEQEDRLYMQMELCKGSLEDYVREQRFIPEERIWSILLDLLLGLKSLHDRQLIHLDIKLDNILITDDEVCKLADFGLVFDLTNRNLHQATEGDSRYIAPELMEGRYTKAVDIFSLGIAVLELSCNLELPSNGPLWQRLRSGSLPPELLCRLSQELQDVIRWMMSPVPESRPSVDTLLRFPRIADLYRERRRWRLVRGVKSYLFRKLCNLRCFLASLVLSIGSSLRLNHAKPSVPPGGHKTKNHRPPNRSYCNGTSGATSPNNSVRTCLMKDFEDDEEEMLQQSSSSGDLDVSGGSRESGSVQITPTLNNTVPSHTPSLRMMNSTPLNHNHIGLRLSFRNNCVETPTRNISYDSGEEDFMFPLDANNASRRVHGDLSRHSSSMLQSPGGGGPSGTGPSGDSSFLTKKKLFFKSDDSD